MQPPPHSHPAGRRAHAQTTDGFESTVLALPLRAGENVIASDDRLPQADTPPGTRAFLFQDFELTAPP